MTQAEIDWPMSLALSAKDRADTKEQSSFDSALSSALVSALGVALQRCSYPPHECRESTMLFHPPFTMGTSLLCRIGGHFYFALTELCKNWASVSLAGTVIRRSFKLRMTA